MPRRQRRATAVALSVAASEWTTASTPPLISKKNAGDQGETRAARKRRGEQRPQRTRHRRLRAYLVTPAPRYGRATDSQEFHGFTNSKHTSHQSTRMHEYSLQHSSGAGSAHDALGRAIIAACVQSSQRRKVQQVREERPVLAVHDQFEHRGELVVDRHGVERGVASGVSASDGTVAVAPRR